MCTSVWGKNQISSNWSHMQLWALWHGAEKQMLLKANSSLSAPEIVQ